MSEELLNRYARAAAYPDEPRLTTGELLELTREYEWWPAPAIELLRRPDAELTPDTREHLRTLIALNCTDLSSRAALTSDRGRLMADFYPATPAATVTGTDDAISTFLETYGHSSPEEDRLLEQMIFNPVPDYGAVLAVDDDEAPDAADESSSIDAFVKAFATPAAEEPATPAPAPAKRQTPAPAPAPASSLSESLAKIYIKQGRYNKAYEIILHLYLNNPKKSIYFADQLRFLRKLMLNSQSTDNATN